MATIIFFILTICQVHLIFDDFYDSVIAGFYDAAYNTSTPTRTRSALVNTQFE